MMSSEKLNNFSESNPVQMTLREEIELINQDLTDYKRKYKETLM